MKKVSKDLKTYRGTLTWENSINNSTEQDNKASGKAIIHSVLALKVKVKSLGVSDSMTPQTVAHQAPPSMRFSRQEYWSGLPFPSLGDLPKAGIEPRSPALRADALTSEPPGKPCAHISASLNIYGLPTLCSRHTGLLCSFIPHNTLLRPSCVNSLPRQAHSIQGNMPKITRIVSSNARIQTKPLNLNSDAHSPHLLF